MASTTATSDKPKLFSVQDMATEFSKTHGRIRQVCRDHGIGTLYGGRVRLLKPVDVRKLRKYFSKSGRNSSSCD